MFDPERALELLRSGSGLREAEFRDGQAEAIQHVVDARGRLLVVQKTGWGKSFVYFIATRLLRDQGLGPAILVSPLIALMRNQIEAANRMGVRAATINSDNQSAWDNVEEQLRRDEVDILLVSPERLSNERFRSNVLATIGSSASLLVVDEAHCISDWGHDFRPHYRLIERTLSNLPRNLRVLATTATANDRVMGDLADILGPDLSVMRGPLERDSLTLQTIKLDSQAERLAWLAERLAELDGHGIIYALTIRDANLVARWLRAIGFEVKAYTGETGEGREELEQALLQNRVKALVATTALGMGFDKPDLSFVIHYQRPGSVVAYYQQVGRAGRALDSAYGVLLSGKEDGSITDWFISSAFPSRGEVESVLSALEASRSGLSIDELLVRVNTRAGRIEKAVTLLSLESPAPIVKSGPKWQLAASELDPAFWTRVERLTELRRAEAAQMEAYVDLPFGEHMPFLVRALDGNASSMIGPRLPPLPSTVAPALANAAIAFLKGSRLTFEPRKRWPAGGLPLFGVGGHIQEGQRSEPGRALSAWGDQGWGRLVELGKYRDGRFSDELVGACVKLLSDWAPQPAPTWVACVPSLRRPNLVPDFAYRLAEALEIPFRNIVVKTDDRPEQKSMKNRAFQARNLDGALVLSSAPPPDEAVLLVDDMVDSRWTMTVAAWLLRKNGAGKVWPLALSLTNPGD